MLSVSVHKKNILSCIFTGFLSPKFVEACQRVYTKSRRKGLKRILSHLSSFFLPDTVSANAFAQTYIRVLAHNKA